MDGQLQKSTCHNIERRKRRHHKNIPISISRSNLPGRLKAGSILSGRFVVAITSTRSFMLISSISFRSVATILRDNSSLPSFRVGAMASNSSIKTLKTVVLLIVHIQENQITYLKIKITPFRSQTKKNILRLH